MDAESQEPEDLESCDLPVDLVELHEILAWEEAKRERTPEDR